MVLEAIKYTRGSLLVLDQLQLPYTTHFNEVKTATEGWHAIKSMRTRGAPAIAIVAALSLAVELTHETLSPIPEEVAAFIVEKLDYLETSRPTAVNLADAVRKLKRVVEGEKGRLTEELTVQVERCKAVKEDKKKLTEEGVERLRSVEEEREVVRREKEELRGRCEALEAELLELKAKLEHVMVERSDAAQTNGMHGSGDGPHGGETLGEENADEEKDADVPPLAEEK